MKKTNRILNQTIFLLTTAFLSAVLLSSCLIVQRDVAVNDSVLVRTQPEDTTESLAQEYLHTSSKAWEISEFNQIETVNAGEEVVIPLKPFKRGGITPRGIQTVPIIVYAGFSRSKAGKYMVLAKDFEEQMKYLNDNGYHSISLAEFYDFLDYKRQIPAKSLVITIDSTRQSVVEIAYPILKKYGYQATIFVYTDSIGKKNTLSWNDLKKLYNNGLHIESHSNMRRNLSTRKKGESFTTYFKVLNEGITESKALIRENIGQESHFFAYPYGETNGLVIEMLKKKGYRGALTYERGSNPFYTDPFRVKRSLVYSGDSLKTFRKNIDVFNKMSLN